jgi:hypothetical protein
MSNRMRLASFLATAMLGIGTTVAAQIPHGTSGHFAFGVDVTPIRDAPSEYLMKVTVADGESGRTIVNPGFRIDASEPVALTLGEEPGLAGVACIKRPAPRGWCIDLVAGADGGRNHAALEAVVSHDGEIVSRHRFKVRLDR